MRKYVALFLIISMLASFSACRKNKSDDVTQPNSEEVETTEKEEETKENKGEISGFSGGILEESSDGNADNNDTEQSDESTQESVPEVKEDSSDIPGKNGISYSSEESDMLEPPADSSAGVM